jgi:hypothetical protein
VNQWAKTLYYLHDRRFAGPPVVAQKPLETLVAIKAQDPGSRLRFFCFLLLGGPPAIRAGPPVACRPQNGNGRTRGARRSTLQVASRHIERAGRPLQDHCRARWRRNLVDRDALGSKEAFSIAISNGQPSAVGGPVSPTATFSAASVAVPHTSARQNQAPARLDDGVRRIDPTSAQSAWQVTRRVCESSGLRFCGPLSTRLRFGRDRFYSDLSACGGDVLAGICASPPVLPGPKMTFPGRAPV